MSEPTTLPATSQPRAVTLPSGRIQMLLLAETSLLLVAPHSVRTAETSHSQVVSTTVLAQSSALANLEMDAQMATQLAEAERRKTLESCSVPTSPVETFTFFPVAETSISPVSLQTPVGLSVLDSSWCRASSMLALERSGCGVLLTRRPEPLGSEACYLVAQEAILQF